MSVTLKDIAAKTGFSINTVSHALRGSSDISAKTAEYIRRTADEMGYIGNAVAASMRRGKSRTIAVIIGCIFNPHFSIMIKGIEEAAAKDGYTVLILNTNENEETERNAIKTAIGKKCDGIILCPVQKTKDNLRLLIASEMPFVLLGRHYKEIDTAYVVCDDYGGGYKAADYLLRKGKEKIAVLLPPRYVSSASERFAGIDGAMREHGKTLSPECIIPIDLTDSFEEAIENGRDTLLSSDAVICFSDMAACELIYWLRRNGVPVPGPIDIIGFDDIQSRIIMPIRVKSVKSYKTQMSHTAYELLSEKINKPGTPNKHVVISTDLSNGETA